MPTRVLRLVMIGAAVLIVVVQIVPYGRNHSNPPIRKEPPWDTPRTRVLAVRACFDCHSNETGWPWYANVAPVSWLVQRDVDEGRRAVNYSEWDRRQEDAAEAAQAVEKGSMPPWYYPWARLSVDERQALIRGLEATFGRAKEGKGDRRRRGGGGPGN